MRKSASLGPGFTSDETVWGFVYFCLSLTVLPELLPWVNGALGHPLSAAEVNFAYYFLNFMIVMVLFHRFLGSSVSAAWRQLAYLCQSVILGLAAYYACTYAVDHTVKLLVPSYVNYNDASIAALGRGNFFLTALGTVVLVPPVEEIFFRGLIFRTLWPKSRWGAYLVSMLAFTAIHIIGYLGSYSVTGLLIALAQYLPAGLCLAWSYTKGETILTPMIVHAVINYFAIQHLR